MDGEGAVGAVVVAKGVVTVCGGCNGGGGGATAAAAAAAYRIGGSAGGRGVGRPALTMLDMGC